MLQYLKKRLIFLFIMTCAVFFLVFFPQRGSAADAADGRGETAYLACFVDDTTFTYKTQVIFSGMEVEAFRVTRLLQLDNRTDEHDCALESLDASNYVWGAQSSLFLSGVNDRIPIYNFRNYDDNRQAPKFNAASDDWTDVRIRLEINNDNGQFAISPIVDSSSGQGNGFDLRCVKWNEFSTYMPRPLTFPSNTYKAEEEDINRAYKIQELLTDDFRDALSYVNDGKSFENSADLIETAFAVLTADDDGIVTNRYGTKYRIDYGNNSRGGYLDEDSNGYLYYIKISQLDGNNQPVTTKNFNYKVKKGYAGANTGEFMEDGSKNTLRHSDFNTVNDTVYISWEQLFVEAGILYAEGISYANQGDIFVIDSLQKSLVATLRDFFIQMRGYLQLYSVEDCFFNNGIRGTKAFVFGVYNTNWNRSISVVFLVCTVIVISLVIFALLRIINKAQIGAVIPSSRFSAMEGVKDLLVSLLILGFTWFFLKLAMLINERFVSIFATMVGSRSLVSTDANLSTLAGILYQFTFFAITIYINFVYILRSIVVPVLIATAPLFIIAYSFGVLGKNIAIQWLREVLGNIFIQSVHALIYGILLSTTYYLRGIESIVVCASVIPLTNIFRSLTGIGMDEILKKAGTLTTLTSAGIGTAASQIGKPVAALGELSSAAGHPIAGGLLSGSGNVLGSAGGAFNMGVGTGLTIATGDSYGIGMATQGANQMWNGMTTGLYGRGGIGGGVRQARIEQRFLDRYGGADDGSDGGRGPRGGPSGGPGGRGPRGGPGDGPGGRSPRGGPGDGPGGGLHTPLPFNQSGLPNAFGNPNDMTATGLNKKYYRDKNAFPNATQKTIYSFNSAGKPNGDMVHDSQLQARKDARKELSEALRVDKANGNNALLNDFCAKYGADDAFFYKSDKDSFCLVKYS